LIEGLWANKSSCWTRSEEALRSCESSITGGFFLDEHCQKVSRTTTAASNEQIAQSTSASNIAGTIAAAVLVPLVVILLLLAAVMMFVFWRRRMFWFRASSKTSSTVMLTESTSPSTNSTPNNGGDYQTKKLTSNGGNRPSSEIRKTLLPTAIDLSGWLIPAAELSMEQEIGRGASGIVFKAKWRGTPVAVKRILSTDMSDKDLTSFVAEISLMRALRPHGKGSKITTLFFLFIERILIHDFSPPLQTMLYF
jgi:hypothetical protein